MLKKMARHFGYSLQKISKSESEQDILHKAIVLGDVDLIMDCGANHGQFYQHCRQSGYSGPMWCMEPHPSCLTSLEKLQATDSKLTVIPVATGDRDTRLTLQSAGSQDDLSSFLDQKPLLTERFKRAEVEGSIEVDVRRLEAILDERDLDSETRLFLKVDTQGYDLVTLEGLGQRIGQVRAIKAEMSVQAVYEGAPSHWEMLDFFRSHGFEPFYFSTVTRDLEGRYIEYDAYFIR